MEIQVRKDEVYSAGERPLYWDVYRGSQTSEDAPVVLVAHGGGWRSGHRSLMEAACVAFARRGYTAIAPEYRLLDEAPWPGPRTDLQTAVGAVNRSRERLRISSGPVFLAGFSAGAHLSLLTAANMRGDVAGVAAFYPPARMTPQLQQMLGIDDPETLAAAEPIAHVARLPPTIVFCGDADPLTPPEQALELYQAVRAAGVAGDLRLYSDLIHEFVTLPGMMDQVVDDTVRFFDRTVIGRESFGKALDEYRAWWAALLAGAPPG